MPVPLIVLISVLVLAVLLFLLVNETGIVVRLESDYRKLDPLAYCRPIEYRKKANTAAALLLHEFSGSPSSLEYLGRAVFKSGLDVYIPAMPSAAEKMEDLERLKTPPHLELWYRFALDRYRALKKKYRQVFIVGASLGGSAGLMVAETENPDGLVLLAAPVRLTGRHFRRALTRNLMIAFSGMVALFAKKVRTGVLPPAARKIEKARAAEGLLYPASIHLQKVRMRKARRRLGLVKCPVLLYHALQDRTVDVKNCDVIARGVSSGLVVKNKLDLSADKLTRCHRLADHALVRQIVAAGAAGFIKGLRSEWKRKKMKCP